MIKWIYKINCCPHDKIKEDEHLYTKLEYEFITHRTVLCRNISEAKQMYCTRIFDFYKNYIKTHGLS